MTGSVGSASPEQLFGAAVRAARQVRGWSQEALAAELTKVGVNVGGQSGAARIERGERPTRLNEVIAIADFLGIKLDMELGAYGRASRMTEEEELVAMFDALGGELAMVHQKRAEAQARVHQSRQNLAVAQDELAVLDQQIAQISRTRDSVLHGIAAAANAKREVERRRSSNGDR